MANPELLKLPKRMQATAVSNLFRRNSVYVSSIFVGAFAFGIGFDTAMTKWWEVRRISEIRDIHSMASILNCIVISHAGAQQGKTLEGYPR
jgi:hypothetical protein